VLAYELGLDVIRSPPACTRAAIPAGKATDDVAVRISVAATLVVTAVPKAAHKPKRLRAA
jgi:hypothetical protein